MQGAQPPTLAQRPVPALVPPFTDNELLASRLACFLCRLEPRTLNHTQSEILGKVENESIYMPTNFNSNVYMKKPTNSLTTAHICPYNPRIPCFSKDSTIYRLLTCDSSSGIRFPPRHRRKKQRKKIKRWDRTASVYHASFDHRW